MDGWWQSWDKMWLFCRLFSGPSSKPETLMDKTKKFLAALVKFGASVSPSVGTNVRKLVFRLAVSILLSNRSDEMHFFFCLTAIMDHFQKSEAAFFPDKQLIHRSQCLAKCDNEKLWHLLFYRMVAKWTKYCDMSLLQTGCLGVPEFLHQLQLQTQVGNGERKRKMGENKGKIKRQLGENKGKMQ